MLDQLPNQWRAKAEHLERFAPPAAEAFREAAAELERELATAETELLSLEQGAEASGYSADHLGRLVRTGKIPNLGRPNAPRIRRADLPVKPAKGRPAIGDTRARSASLPAIARDAITAKLPRSRRA
jgi:hypothetical protein